MKLAVKTLFITSSVFLTLMVSVPASASDGVSRKEKAAILQIIKELDYITDLTRKSRSFQKPLKKNKRNVGVGYEYLISDLTDMRDSLARHVNNPARTPRDFDELNLKYERNRAK